MKRFTLVTSLAAALLLVTIFALGATATPVSAQAACTDYSPEACDTIPVDITPSYCLAWNADEGGLAAGNTLGTGFTMVLPAGNQLADQPAGDPSASQYIASLLDVTGGELRITSTKGIKFQSDTGSTDNNSQVNALGVGYDGATPIEIVVDLVNLDFSTSAGNNSQQAGIWFGIDEDNYVKLVIGKTGTNAGEPELSVEQSAAGGTVAIQSAKGGAINNLNTSIITLTMSIDPAANTVTGSYIVNGGPDTTIATQTFPASFETGVVPGVGSGAVTFAGLFATHRRAAADQEIVARFDNFCINRTGNIEPVVADDAYTVDANATLTTTTVDGVLVNDTDFNVGDTLTADLVTDVTNGTLALNVDGSFTYTPNTDYVGPDTFTYRAFDGTAFSNTNATVTIDVQSTNAVPVANDDAYTVDEDNTLTVNMATGVLANDTDADLDPLTAALVTDVTNGTLTLNADGSFTYIPDANFSGADGFTYVANDGTQDSATAATVTINVNAINDVPVANDDNYTTGQGVTLTVNAANGVIANDVDPDIADVLVAQLVVGPQFGSFALNPDGSFTYTPIPTFNGIDTFTYRLSDGVAQSNIATVTILIDDANDPPVANDDVYSVVTNNTLTVDAATGVLANDTDPENNTLTATKLTDPAQGALTFNADGSFTYIPVTDFLGTVSFTYEVTDGEFTDGPATVTINVTEPQIQVLDNGSFETQAANDKKQPIAWRIKNDTKENRRCDKPEKGKTFSLSGSCAFRFKGVQNENSKLVQKYFPAAGELGAGDTVGISIWVEGTNVVPNAGAAVTVKLIYTDGTKNKNIDVRFDGGTYAYRQYTASTTATKPVDRIKVQVQYKGETGKFFVDDVELSVSVGSPAPITVTGERDGVSNDGPSTPASGLPLPPAADNPDGFRG